MKAERMLVAHSLIHARARCSEGTLLLVPLRTMSTFVDRIAASHLP
jgi:hypothetical protein